MQIPHDSYGYFQVGQKIPVSASADSEANELLVDGVRHPLPFELNFVEPGLREIELALADHGKILRRKTYPLAIVPFAVKSSKLGALELASQRPELTALGVMLSRVVVSWRELEPNKQEYDWARLDSVMARNRELGIETILCLTGVPAWAKLPQDMAAYTKIWRLLAGRYDDVRLFEVWNSKNPNENIGRENYLPLLRAAAETLRQEIPDAKILAGRIDISDGLANAAWLQKEATAWYDIFSARKYSSEPVKDVWSAAITNATAKPVWNTACGIQQSAPGEPPQKTWPIPTVDEETAAICLVQDLALQLSAGVDRIILDAGPSDYVPDGCAREGLPGKEGLALAVFNGLVGKDAKLGRLSDAPAGVFAIRFENPSGLKGLILFSTGGTVELKVAGARYLDLYGKSAAPVVTGRPIYMLDVVTLNERK
ncbi:MAG: beta-galactosidase [Victivallales bacterium]